MHGIFTPTGFSPALQGARVASRRDFDEIAPALRGLNVDLRQLSAGPFRGEVEAVPVGSFHVMRVAVNRVIQARGAVGPDRALVSLITPANEGANWRGQHLRRGELNVNAPASEIDHLTPGEYESVTIVVDVERLRSAEEAMTGIEGGSRLRATGGYRPAPQSYAALQGVAQSILDLARSRPAAPLSPESWAALEEDLMRSLVSALGGAPIREVRPPNRQRVARSAEEYMLARLRLPLRMTDLCAELGVSERALRYAFRDRFGVSPLAYFKTQKLNAIRREIAGRSQAAGVQEIARQWGIVHLGNFAADYRRLFGESPSQTAGRTPG